MAASSKRAEGRLSAGAQGAADPKNRNDNDNNNTITNNTNSSSSSSTKYPSPTQENSKNVSSASATSMGGLIEVVFDFRKPSCQIFLATVVALLALWQGSKILSLLAVVLLLAIIYACQVLPAKIGLGDKCFISMSLGLTELVFSLNDVDINTDLVDVLPLPFQIHSITAGKCGLAIRPLLMCLEARSSYMDVDIRILEPSSWKDEKGKNAGRAAIDLEIQNSLNVLPQWQESPPAGVVGKLIDAVIGHISLYTDNFDLRITSDADALKLTDRLERVALSVGRLDMPRPTPLGKEDDSWAPRLRWDLTACGFSLDLWPHGKGLGDCARFLPQVTRSEVAFTSPPIMAGLLSNRTFPERRIDLAIDVGGGEVKVNLFQESAEILWGLMNRFFKASEWQQEFVSVFKKQTKAPNAQRRRELVAQLQDKKLKEKPDLMELDGQDQLAIRWWAQNDESRLDFDPDDDEAWHDGAHRLWTRAQQELAIQMKKAPLFRELGFSMHLNKCLVILGDQEVEVRSEGVSVGLDLLPTSTEISLGVVSAVSVGVRPKATTTKSMPKEEDQPKSRQESVQREQQDAKTGSFKKKSEAEAEGEEGGEESTALEGTPEGKDAKDLDEVSSQASDNSTRMKTSASVSSFTATSTTGGGGNPAPNQNSSSSKSPRLIPLILGGTDREGVQGARENWAGTEKGGDDPAVFRVHLSLLENTMVFHVTAMDDTLRLLPVPLMQTLLPNIMCLLEQEEIPENPPVKDYEKPEPPPPQPQQSNEPMSSRVAEAHGFLSGMGINVNLEILNCDLLAPSSVRPRSLDEGLVLSGDQLRLALISAKEKERVTIEVVGARAVVLGGHDVLHKTARGFDIQYTLCWCEDREGILRQLDAQFPYMNLRLSPAVMTIGERAAELIMKDFQKLGWIASGDEPQEEEDKKGEELDEQALKEIEAEKKRRLEMHFKTLDKDNSGELERQEVWSLVEKICVGMNCLSARERSDAFEDLWAAMDVSTDGQVSFEEFCQAIEKVGSNTAKTSSNDGDEDDDEGGSGQGENGKAGGSLGTVAVKVEELSSLEIFVKDDDEESYEKLWEHLEKDIKLQKKQGGGLQEDTESLQWRVLRSLKNYDMARDLWKDELGRVLAPGERWRISPETMYLPAQEVLANAFMGDIARTEASEDPEPSRGASSSNLTPGFPMGLRCCVQVSGFSIGIADPLAALRGQGDRLCIGGGAKKDPVEGEDAPEAAFALQGEYWQQPKNTDAQFFALADSVDAILCVRDFYGSCLNPSRPEPDLFIMDWGMEATLCSKAGEKAVVAHVLSDQHFCLNLGSSLILAIQPVLHTLLPGGGDNREGQLPLSDVWTSPLDHMISVFGPSEGVKGDLLKEYGLISATSDGLQQLGYPAAGEVHAASAEFSKFSRYQVSARLDLPRETSSVTRIVLSKDWTIDRLSREGKVVSILATANGRNVEGRVVAFARKHRTGEGQPHEARNDALEEDESPVHQVSHQRKKMKRKAQVRQAVKPELKVINRCGIQIEAWLEAPEANSSRQSRGKNLPLDELTTLTVDAPDSKLCFRPEGETEKNSLDFKTVGRFAVPLNRRGGNSHNLWQSSCICILLSISKDGTVLVEFLPDLEIRNATQQALTLELSPPPTGERLQQYRYDGFEADPPVKTVVVPAGDVLHVPHTALTSAEPWAISTSGGVAHALALSKPLLTPGTKEAHLRRRMGLALESHTMQRINAPADEAHQFSRYSLLLLPGLRVVNALPFSFQLALERLDFGGEEPERRDVRPGLAVDFGGIARGCRVVLRCGESDQDKYSIEFDAATMQDRKKFLNRHESFDLAGMQCSLQCSWTAATGPELAVCATHIVFNKTGLQLQVRGHKDNHHHGETLPLMLEKPVVVRTEKHTVQVKVNADNFPEQSQEDQEQSLPRHKGPLEVQVQSTSLAAVLEWKEVEGQLEAGELTLKDSNDEIFTTWNLSKRTKFQSVDVHQAGGADNAFSLADPALGQVPLLRAPDREGLSEWLRVLRSTSTALNRSGSIEELKGVWDTREQGRCILAPMPKDNCDVWSVEVPVQTADAGEVVIKGGSKQEPLCSFLGVQVQPLVGLLARSVGVTFTPRFVVQNRSDLDLQLLPALKPKDQRKWQSPEEAGRGSIREPSALWLSARENVALYHFPMWCSASDVGEATKAVAIRLAGQAQLELRTEKGFLLPLQQVVASFMPYQDADAKFGSLPQSLRVLERSHRLQCFRGYAHEDAKLGKLKLNRGADIFVAVPSDNVPEFLKEDPWKLSDDTLPMRLRGHPDTSLQIYTRRAEPGQLNLKTLPPRTVLLVSQLIFAMNSTGQGLPWSRWINLQSTGNLSQELEGPAGSSKHFIRCSVQVEQSTAYLVITTSQAPYRVENRSPSRTLAVMYEGCRGRCTVLPPLHWCAFDWPDPEANERRLVILDMRSSKRGIFDADASGKASPMKVSESAERVSGASAALNEAGYESVKALLDPREMKQYIHRLTESMRGRWSDEHSLQNFAKEWCEQPNSSLRGLCQSLILKGAVPRHKPQLTQDGLQWATLCDLTMEDFINSVLDSAGLEAADGFAVRRLARDQSSNPSLHTLIEKVGRAEWTKAKRPPDIAYDRAVSLGSKVGVQLCLWRAMHELKAANNAPPTAISDTAAKILQNPRSYAWKDAVMMARESLSVKHGGKGKRKRKHSTETGGSGLPNGRSSSRRPSTLSSALQSSGQQMGEAAAASSSQQRQSQDNPQGPEAAVEKEDSPNSHSPPGQQGSSSGEPIDEEDDVSDEENDGQEPGEEENEEARAARSLMEQNHSVVAFSEPLTEEGFRNVASLRSTSAMSNFIERVVEDDSGTIMQRSRLSNFAERYSGGWWQQSLANLRQDLATQDWINFGSCGDVSLYIDRRMDGLTKVLTLSEKEAPETQRSSAINRKKGSSVPIVPNMDRWKLDVQLAGLHLTVNYDSTSHVLGTGYKAAGLSRDEELVSITADHLRISKALKTESNNGRRVELSLHHFQIDNMREGDRYKPIIVAPLDSGYHGHRHPNTHQQRKAGRSLEAKSFLYLSFEQCPSNILHIKELQLIIQPVTVRLDSIFWINIVKMSIDWIPGDNGSSGEDADITEKYVEDLCTEELKTPSVTTSTNLMLLEFLRLGAVISQVEVIMPKISSLTFSRGGSSQDGGDTFDDEDDQGGINSQSVWLVNFLSRVTYKSTGVLKQLLTVVMRVAVWSMQTVCSGLISGIGHVAPKFNFPERVIKNELSDFDVFLNNLMREYVNSGLKQAWRVLFSTNILGDPIGLASSVGGSLFEFARKTGSEIHSADLKGEGVAILANGVVGTAFGHAGKFLGAVGETVDALADDSSDPAQYGTVQHAGDGFVVGTKVVLHSLAAGLAGTVTRPIEGYREGGMAGFARGVGSGMGGFFLKPVSGVLHGAQYVAEGVQVNVQNATDRFLGITQMRPRREPQAFKTGNPIINQTIFAPNITIFVAGLKMKEDTVGGATYCVHLYILDRESQHVRWEKRSRLGRVGLGCLLFEEVKWCPTEDLMHGELRIEVQDYAGSDDPEHPAAVYEVSHSQRSRDNWSHDILEYVGDILRRPDKDDHLRRLRPKKVFTVKMVKVQDHPRPTGESVELLLKFWPAWDPDTVPLAQRWHQPQGELPLLQLKRPEHLPELRGFLEKRARGSFNHWSVKWVVVKDREFQYWDNKQRYDRQEEPKKMFKLAELLCPFRFACAGPEEPDVFLQMQANGGEVQARWRLPTTRINEVTQGAARVPLDEWLQAILMNSIAGL